MNTFDILHTMSILRGTLDSQNTHYRERLVHKALSIYTDKLNSTARVYILSGIDDFAARMAEKGESLVSDQHPPSIGLKEKATWLECFSNLSSEMQMQEIRRYVPSDVLEMCGIPKVAHPRRRHTLAQESSKEPREEKREAYSPATVSDTSKGARPTPIQRDLPKVDKYIRFYDFDSMKTAENPDRASRYYGTLRGAHSLESVTEKQMKYFIKRGWAEEIAKEQYNSLQDEENLLPR